MWISVRRTWLGFFKSVEPDKGMFHFYQFVKNNPFRSGGIVDWITSQRCRKDILNRRSEMRTVINSSITSVSMLGATWRVISRLIESIDRGKSHREMWIRPPARRRAAQFAHYRESEDKRAPYPPRCWKELGDTFFHGLVRGDSRARFASRKRDFEETRKRNRSGFILHLWQRARMLFLSKLSPIWNIRSLTLRTDTLLFFSFSSRCVGRAEMQFFDTIYWGDLDVNCGDSLRNAETRMLLRQAVGRMIYDCCDFLCQSVRDMYYLIDLSIIRRWYR